jgi:hypothetical protein
MVGAVDRHRCGARQLLGDHVDDRREERGAPCSVGQQRWPVEAGQVGDVDAARIGM